MAAADPVQPPVPLVPARPQALQPGRVRDHQPDREMATRQGECARLDHVLDEESAGAQSRGGDGGVVVVVPVFPVVPVVPVVLAE